MAIGDLRVIERIGQGRYGTDFRATGPDGEVELGLLELGEDAELRARVRDALERLATIEHRGLRRIYEVGDHGDSVFVTMDLAPDRTLAEIVNREGALSEERVAAIVEQTAAAVAALHDGGVVHAEVSPETLFIGEDDEVSLAPPLQQALADLGAVVVEPMETEYAAPEIVTGARGSRAADVWGLGAVAYTALTGEPPEARRSIQAVRPGVSDSWEPMIERAMAADPGARPSAAELAEEPVLLDLTDGGGLAPVHSDEPPRRSYARLGAPDVVYAEEPFDVILGLSPDPDPKVGGSKMTLPDSVRGSYLLTIHLVTSGFRLEHGDDWTVELKVSAGAPYPAGVLRLIPEASEEGVRPLLLKALYSVDGQTIGQAVRPIAVCRDHQETAAEPEPIEPGFEVWLPEDWKPTDLEIAILKDPANRDRGLLWTFKSKHPEVKTPKNGISSDIGSEPQKFASDIVRAVPAHEGKADMHSNLRGLGRRIADQMPAETWDLLAEVAERNGGEPPSVLLLSEEPYVPWELAEMEVPLDADRARFLGAQATVGRWVLGARSRPPTPPPRTAEANSIAVVSGTYETANLKRLKEAEEEAEDLHLTYEAKKVDARIDTVNKCLEGDPQSDILHFAVHGRYGPHEAEDGILLVDREVLDPTTVNGVTFDPPRFVFLNACQVGTGAEVLGDYAGLASAFLHAGACAVVAPLWSVDDRRARALAKSFYEAAFKGTSPAAFLRDQRGSFKKESSTNSSTQLAYQFFGHPDMLMVRGDAGA
ncbi:MAG TPA: CHAT domain-containing protein [Solirubrobacterales bacterium]|nr:CHAT domain-containing protein [Solirubrobacterales bacterium]